jgi:hypothetical protein
LLTEGQCFRKLRRTCQLIRVAEHAPAEPVHDRGKISDEREAYVRFPAKTPIAPSYARFPLMAHCRRPAIILDARYLRS